MCCLPFFPKFSSSDWSLLGQDNIDVYTAGILLSPKLSQYKGTSAVKYVMVSVLGLYSRFEKPLSPADYHLGLQDVIKHQKVNVPPNFDKDHHVTGVINTVVTNQLSQVRSDIKKKANSLSFFVAESDTDVFNRSNNPATQIRLSTT